MAKKRISSSEADIRRFIEDSLKDYPLEHPIFMCLERRERSPNDLIFSTCNVKKRIAIRISLREFIEKRQSLKGITKRLRKAIRGKKK